MKEFDIEKLERKSIYKVPDNLFESIQEKVMNDVKANKKAPIFKMNWVYAVAASLALVFGATFIYNQNNDSTKERGNSGAKYVANNKKAPKADSEIAYETLKSDVKSVEKSNQIVENQESKTLVSTKQNVTKVAAIPKAEKTASKQTEAQMNEYLDSFSNSEISELASNSTQDVYLDLYN